MTEDQIRIRFTLVAMGMVLASNFTGWLLKAGPMFALWSTAFTLTVMVGWTAWRRDPVLARWLLLGLVGGWVELLTDAWLVRSTHTLFYPENEPMVLDSPLYMPFAWTLVLAQLGIVGRWLAQRMSLVKASVATALLGGSMIPLYEHLADGAGYWWYADTPMVMDAPYYIIVSEFLLALPLVWLGTVAEARRWRFSAVLGLVAGLWMTPSVWIAWQLVGPCQGALIQLRCG